MSSRPAWARVCLKKTQQKCHSLSPKQASWGLPQTQQPLLTLVVSLCGETKPLCRKPLQGHLSRFVGQPGHLSLHSVLGWVPPWQYSLSNLSCHDPMRGQGIKLTMPAACRIQSVLCNHWLCILGFNQPWLQNTQGKMHQY
jgi:hypothetical protein